MPSALTKDQRNLLARVTQEAREVAETAARAALENLAVHESEYRGHMTVDQRLLRNRLRARGRALGDRLDPRTGTQAIDHLAESAAYEHWHRLLFTRFLAENHLLHTDAEHDNVPVTLEECGELAPELFGELGARDGFDLACRFASQTLPGVFRRDDPVLELRLAPNHEVQLRRLLDQLQPEIFRADDALGWTYQFWQAKRKDQINRSGVKIGADELPAVIQLFTEDYRVEVLLHNSLGAWWAAKERGRLARDCTTESQARQAVALPPRDGLPGINWAYLRFHRGAGVPPANRGQDGRAPFDERALLAAAGARSRTLEEWLRDEFFEQHCKLFKNRPFIWHLWDGRKDGFHALVNYHRLDHANLQKLTYSDLGDWIRQQEADARADKPGAAERLGAAQALERELMKILEGEPPYDLFIRWKPLKEQPLGWQPDLNDGVRLNIRPFMLARDLGKKGAGILRAKPNIKWDKDRGKEPQRDKADDPWFWHATEPPLGCPGGPEFTGNRWNDVHLTLARKRAARDAARAGPV